MELKEEREKKKLGKKGRGLGLKKSPGKTS